MSDKLIIEVDLVKGDTKGALGKGIKKDAARGGVIAGAAFGRSFSGAVSTQLASTLGLAALLGTLIKSTRAAVEFQTAFAEINTLLPKTAQLTRQNADALRDLADEFGTSAASQAKSFYQIVSSGITDTAKATKLLTTANRLAVGGLASVEGSIDLLTTAINAYGQENLSAVDAADSLFTAVRLGKITISELAANLGVVLTPAKQMGVRFDEVSAAMALFTKKGVDAAVGTTQFNALLASFTINLKKLGPEFSQSSIRANGFASVLEKLNKLTGGSAKKLTELLVNQRAVRGAQILLSDSGREYIEILDQFEKKTGATGAAFRTIAETDAFKLKKALTNISNVLERLGETLLPTVAAGFEHVLDIINLITGKSILGAQASTQLEVVNEKLASLIDKEQKLVRIRENSKRSGRALPEQIRAIDARIVATQKEIAVLQKFLSIKKAIKEEITKPVDDLTLDDDTSATPAAFGTIGLDQIQIFESQLFKQQEILDAAFEQRLLSQEEFQMRSDFITQQAADKTAALLLKNESNQLASFDNIAAGFQASVSKQAVSSKAIANTLTKGAGQAAAAMGKAAAAGENVNQAFVDAAKNTASDAASAFGDYYIKLGVAELAATQGAMGGKTLAGGLALKAIAGALGGSSGGAGGGGGGEGVGNVNPRALDPLEARERADAQQQFSITVQGDIFDSDETGTRLAEIFSEAGAKQGILVTDVQNS